MGKFKLFSYNPPKKGVSKNDERASVQTDFVGFFYMLGRKFWNISNMNLLMAVYILFVAAGFWLLSGIPWAFWLFALISLLLFGLVNAGTTYITRGYVRGDPVYILSDFKYALKNNWKQGIVLGIIDFLLVFILVFDIMFWMGPIDFSSYLMQPEEQQATEMLVEEENTEDLPNMSVQNDNMSESSSVNNEETVDSVSSAQSNEQSFFKSVSFYGCLFLLFIYFMMRNYIYLLAVTFKLSLFKILKNSFIFAFVGLKRNIMALIGIIVVCAINYFIFINLPVVGIVLPLIITVGLCSFIGAYASYPVIKKYMITPYYEEEEVNEAYDKIFVDRE